MIARADYRPGLIPDEPGVYIYRDQFRQVIYVGKALSLRRRMGSYFQASRMAKADPKLRSLIHSIAWIEWRSVRSGAEALLLESRLIKEYSPRYNILMRDDKQFVMIKLRLADPWPRLLLTRQRKDDGSAYFGPFPDAAAARATVEFLTDYFQLRSCTVPVPGPDDKRHCKEHILRRCSAPCDGKISSEDYAALVQQARAVLEGDLRNISADIEDDMRLHAAKLNFEKAARLRDILQALRTVASEQRNFRQAHIRPETGGTSLAELLAGLAEALSLAQPPRVIECFDNSNFQGAHAVSAMVRFVDGRPDRAGYRHFQVKTVAGIDDFATMAEVVGRRYRRLLEENRPLPDLILIDGGKGQVAAAHAALMVLMPAPPPHFGLAKRFEILFRPGQSEGIVLDLHSPQLQLLQYIRDEAHRFAISFHRASRAKALAFSILDDMPGVGPVRKRQLLTAFSSVANLRQCQAADICAKIPGFPAALAESILAALQGSSPS